MTQFIFSIQNLNGTFMLYYPLCSYMKTVMWSITSRTIDPSVQSVLQSCKIILFFPFNDLYETCETWSHYKKHLNYELRWLTDLTMMPPGRLLGEVLQACPTWRRPRGRQRAQWRDCISQLSWERLGVPQDELEEVGEGSLSFSAQSAPTNPNLDKW